MCPPTLHVNAGDTQKLELYCTRVNICAKKKETWLNVSRRD